MKIYIVRHGESEGNLSRIHMIGSDPLSKKGIKQAKRLCKRFTNIPIDLIITSSFIRAKTTAQIIQNNILKPLVSSKLFVEAKRPSEIELKKIDIPETIEIRMLIKANYERFDFRYSDEETFLDLKDRALKAINYLEKKNYNNLLVVSHGDFIRMIVMLVIIGKDATPQDYLNMRNIHFDNTGISILEYDKAKWSVNTLNDHAHIP